jgi:6,7-dimethyl-8-ribityllumazine synthase
MARHFLIIDARFYDDIADELVRGATAELEARGATYDRVSVPGVLEVPAALAMALQTQERGESHQGPRYQGYVLLGCVIRGETSHYDIVANESARAIMTLVIEKNAAVGNGILTVENRDQALVRASTSEKDKGGVAAAAAFEMAVHRKRFSLRNA